MFLFLLDFEVSEYLGTGITIGFFSTRIFLYYIFYGKMWDKGMVRGPRQRMGW